MIKTTMTGWWFLLTLMYRGKSVEILSQRPMGSFYDWNVRVIETGTVVAVRKHELVQKL